MQQALWDLFAKSLGMPLSRLLGGTRERVRAYASGLCFHLSDEAFSEFFGRANELGYSAFKIKVGHPDIEWDLNRLRLLTKAVRKDALVMVDANEAWSAKEAAVRLDVYRRAGRELLWVEDPIPRDDFVGLKMLRNAAPWTQINSGEYLDLAGKLALLDAEGADMLNVHGPVTDVMRVGWIAAHRNIPVTLGNTFLELGVNMAVALPEAQWLEYSFQNYNHLVEQPIEITGWVCVCAAAAGSWAGAERGGSEGTRGARCADPRTDEAAGVSPTERLHPSPRLAQAHECSPSCADLSP